MDILCLAPPPLLLHQAVKATSEPKLPLTALGKSNKCVIWKKGKGDIGDKQTEESAVCFSKDASQAFWVMLGNEHYFYTTMNSKSTNASEHLKPSHESLQGSAGQFPVEADQRYALNGQFSFEGGTKRRIIAVDSRRRVEMCIGHGFSRSF